jgi:hypothetical protein
MSAGPRTQFDLVEDFWQKLLAADDRVMARARAGAARRQLRRTLVLAILAILGLAALGFAARALLMGDDAPRVFPTSDRLPGLGAPRPGTAELLPVRALDPAAGVGQPPWGLRLFSTDADNVCLQAGRVVDGMLVALGTAGAFGNDGLAHRLPVEAEACAPMVAGRRPRIVGASTTDTSAMATREPRDPAQARTVVYGLAYPGVTAVILRAGSSREVHDISDPRRGAYLFVLAGGPPEPLEVVARYADGEVCRLAFLGPATPEQLSSNPCLYRRPGG